MKKQQCDLVSLIPVSNFARLLICLLALAPHPALADGLPQTNSADTVGFEKVIQPIFADKCLACHGLDESNREGDLRLDDRELAVSSGAIKPGDPTSSSLVERIFSADPELVMPPPDSHKTLTDDEKKALEKWISQGAEYKRHWAFDKPRLPAIPTVSDSAWVRNPIDSFILSKLDSLKITPAPEADLRTLVRRVCLDLTGLPPTPQEIQEVVDDPSPDRYELYVDRLLNRETWGEHRGRYWLDYARYADTHGIHFDNYREMYSYRDWVIRAFNQNMPFDQFTVEQLAGDLLPNPTLDQQIATGFHRCNITTNEGGIIDEEYVVLYARDRVETTGAVWLGLTVGCAVCHNHKFDPITQKEFYELSAFFNNTTQAPRDGNVKNTPPIVQVPTMGERGKYSELKQEQSAVVDQLSSRKDAAKPEFQSWMASGRGSNDIEQSMRQTLGESKSELVFHAPLAETQSTQVAYSTNHSEIYFKSLASASQSVAGAIADHAWVNQQDLQPTWSDVGDFESDAPFSVSLWIRPTKDNSGAGAVIARMNPAESFRGWDVWLEGGNVCMHLVNRWPENACKVRSSKALKPETWNHVVITYDGSKKASGFQYYLNGNLDKLQAAQDTLSETTKTGVPFRLGSREGASPTPGVGVQDIRLYRGVIEPASAAALASQNRSRYLASRPESQLSGEDTESLFQYYLSHNDQEYQSLAAKSQSIDNELKAIESRGTIAHVMAEKTGVPVAYLLQRGDYDKRLDEVHPKTPNVLHPMASDLPANRLGLAKWLTSLENPLTARVTVNRCWQEIFGKGIVPTSADFGITGMMPSNPELLDYLAVDFQQNGWDIKQFYRQMVVSSAYRQSATVTPEKLHSDPDNTFVSRGPRFRMDAEMLRDYALSAGGLLNPTIGGRSVRPYQPEGVWEAVAMPESDTRLYKLDETPMIYRRSMYTFWKRAAPPASMDILNAPAREVCTVKRERTNTPLQALVTMNDPQFVESARSLAETILLDQTLAAPQQQIQALAARILGRQFLPDEVGIVEQTLAAATEYYASDEAAAKEFLSVGKHPRNESCNLTQCAALTLVANQIFNLDEALCK